MTRASPGRRALWSLPVLLALASAISSGCGDPGKKSSARAIVEPDASGATREDAGTTGKTQDAEPAASLDTAGGGSAVDAPPDAPAADRPGDAAADARVTSDLPSGPQPLGAICEIPGGGMLTCAGGNLCCKPCCDGRPAVCTRPVQNAAGIGVGKCPLPDLTVDASLLRDSLGLGPMSFSTASCEAREACVDTPGQRDALHFEVTTPNLGSSDLVLGSPLSGGITLGSGFVYSRCHSHYHFSGYALYQLLDGTGKEVLRGKKRAFCLEDISPVPGFPLPHSQDPKFDCDYQGIQMGWADTYHNGLTCQFMDVTGVQPGRYILRVTVNPDRIFPELSYDNNSAEVPVTIPAAKTGPTETCSGIVAGLNRECGWRKAGSYPCTPGQRVTVGCGSECGLGTATGDTMLRVCEGDEPCAWPGLGGNDDCTPAEEQHGSRVTIECPAGGRFTVLTGSAYTGEASTCNVAIR